MHFHLIRVLRGGMRGVFNPAELAIVTIGLFHGFTAFRARALPPSLIRRVGHVACFCALCSFMSAG